MLIHAWFVWLIIAALLILAEVFVAGFVLFPIGIGALLASVLAFAGFGTAIQWSAFGLVSLATTALVWSLMKNRKKGPVRQANVEQLIGNSAVVVEGIEVKRGLGKVRLGTDIWRAVTEDGSSLAEDEIVCVCEIQGTQLVVKKEE